jgi:hypothetical protein
VPFAQYSLGAQKSPWVESHASPVSGPAPHVPSSQMPNGVQRRAVPATPAHEPPSATGVTVRHVPCVALLHKNPALKSQSGYGVELPQAAPATAGSGSHVVWQVRKESQGRVALHVAPRDTGVAQVPPAVQIMSGQSEGLEQLAPSDGRASQVPQSSFVKRQNPL